MSETYDNQFNDLMKEKRNIENKYYEKSRKRMERGLFSAVGGVAVGMGSLVTWTDYAHNKSNVIVEAVQNGLSSSFLQENLPNIANMDTGLVIVGTGLAVTVAGAASLGAHAIGSKIAKNVAENIFTSEKLQEKFIHKPMEKINNEFTKIKEKSFLQKSISKIKSLFKKDENKVKLEEKKENDLKNDDTFSNVFENSLKNIDLEKNQVVKRDNKNTNKYKL